MTTPPPRRRPRRSRVALLLLLVVGLAAALEVGVRGVDLVSGRGFGAGRNPLARERRPARPFRQFGEDLVLRDDDGTLVIRSVHGERYPFEKAPGAFRVVVFGGSTTHNMEAWEAERIHYPLVLQEQLREATGRDDIEVINVGFAAYSTAHSLVVLALDALSWDPDVVILSHATNDLHASYFPGFVPDYSNKYGHPSYLGPDLRSEYTPAAVLLQWSEAYWFLRDVLGEETDRSLKRADYPEEPEPEVAAVFARNLRSFAALARSRDVDVVFGSQARHADPTRFARHMGEKPYNDIVRYPADEVAAARHRAFNRILREVAEETGAGFVDNSGMDGVDAYFTDHVHYTPEGIRALAGNYARVLLEREEALR